MTKQEVSGTSKTAKKVNLKGEGSLDAYFSRLWEKFKVFSTPKKSGYLMEQIGVNDDVRRGIRNVQIGQKVSLYKL